MGGATVTKEDDEANERRAREKLLARRKTAREAASSATQTSPEPNAGSSSKSLETPTEDKSQQGLHKEGAKTNNKEEDTVDDSGADASASSSAVQKTNSRAQRSERRKRARERKRDKRMSSRGSGSETSPAAAPGGPRDRDRGPRGGGRYPPPPHHYRDEFGRQPPPHRNDYPPPPGYYDDHRGPPPMRHRGRGGGFPPPHYREGGGIPPGRWERDRGMNALPPHPRGSRRGGRPRSPPPHLSSRDRRHRDDRHHRNRDRRESHRHRSRRGRSHDSRSSRSYSSRSRSRSRSFSSHGSSSSFSSSEDDSRKSEGSDYHSDVSRSRSPSRSRSRSYSHSRSPSPQSPVGNDTKKESKKDDATKKDGDGGTDKDNVTKPLEVDEKKEAVEGNKEDKGGSQSESSPKQSKSPERNNKQVAKRSRSRSHSRSPSEDSLGRSRRRGRERKRKSSRKNGRSSRSLSPSRSPASSVSRSHSPASSYSTSSSHYSRERRRERRSKRRRRRQNRGSSSRDKHSEDGFSKDQRTIFVSQLVMRTTERDLKRYFKKKVGCKVNDVILLRDRRNARNHKGCAYVEVGRIEDVATAVAVSGQPPDFQRFPILVKASEAEKNYVHPMAAANGNLMTSGPMSSATAVTPNNNGYSNTSSSDQEKQADHSAAPGRTSYLPPLRDENGRLIESQKVYVGGLDASVREDHLYALFSPFGNLKKVQLQYHPNTQISRGYAFLTFHDPKVSHLAIRAMAGKIVVGRPLKTGWANQNQQSAASIASGCIMVTSDQFPDNASELTQKALSVLAQMTGATPAAVDIFPGTSISADSGSNAASLATMAEQELDKAMGLAGATTASSNSAPAIPTVADARASMAASGGAVSMGATVAEARASLAADVAARQLAAATSAAAVAAAAETRAAATAKSNFIGNGANGPTLHLLVHNMYDKDEETEAGWEAEIKEEFLDECSKFGKIEHAKVMHTEPGGKIFATFADLQGAKTCAENLAGRWFDKRQLRVDYMPEANPP